MNKLILLTASLATLAGCNKGPEVHETNASVAEIANAVSQSGAARDMYMRAGEWRVSGVLEEMNIPGMPAEARAEMKRVMGDQQKMTFQYCLTPEQAKRPGGRFFSGKEAKNCRYEHFTMGGGKIDAVMNCAGDKAQAMTMAVTGTYSPDSYESRVTMEMKGSPEGTMTMKMRSEARRIGECTAKDLARARAEAGTKG